MLLKWVDFESAGNSVAVLVILSVVGLLLILTMIAIGRQPNTDPKLAFKVNFHFTNILKQKLSK